MVLSGQDGGIDRLKPQDRVTHARMVSAGPDDGRCCEADQYFGAATNARPEEREFTAEQNAGDGSTYDLNGQESRRRAAWAPLRGPASSPTQGAPFRPRQLVTRGHRTVNLKPPGSDSTPTRDLRRARHVAVRARAEGDQTEPQHCPPSGRPTSNCPVRRAWLTRHRPRSPFRY